MKVEISKDQNTLTVNGIEYEAKLNNASPHKSSCKSCDFLDNEFCKIALKTPLNVNVSAVRRCEYQYRNDKRPIYWVKKEAEKMTETPAPAPAPAPHRHFDLIVQWAKDPTQQVWAWNSIGAQWVWIKDPEWVADFYALGEKPTEPPMLKVKVKIKLDLDNFIIEVPHSARMSEVEKLILDKAVQFVTCKHEFLN